MKATLNIYNQILKKAYLLTGFKEKTSLIYPYARQKLLIKAVNI